MPRIQFILKHRDNSYTCDPDGGYSNTRLSSGLMNSARLVAEMLRDRLGYETRLDHAIDNNCIDRLVTEYRPAIVVIEAYWVVPEKFAVLAKLHPHITWVVRNHSPTPFASNEGIVFDWSLRYMDYDNVVLSCNDDRTDKEFRRLIASYKPHWSEHMLDRRCVHLPNFYPGTLTARKPLAERDVIDIGCFGAIRPLKNQVMQAVAAIEYAESIGKKLRFHINATRLEGRGEPVLHNIQKMFALLTSSELVEHAWMPHSQFLELVRTMDIGMQVSYSESFNIVTADMVCNDVPVVGSPDIRWMHPWFQADPNDCADIVRTLRRVQRLNRKLHFWRPNLSRLIDYDDRSALRWLDFLTSVLG